MFPHRALQLLRHGRQAWRGGRERPQGETGRHQRAQGPVPVPPHHQNQRGTDHTTALILGERQVLDLRLIRLSTSTPPSPFLCTCDLAALPSRPVVDLPSSLHPPLPVENSTCPFWAESKAKPNSLAAPVEVFGRRLEGVNRPCLPPRWWIMDFVTC